MSEINSFSDYESKYKVYNDYSALFSSAVANNSVSSGNDILTNYAAIKNGSYGKALKSYYAQEKAERMGAGLDSTQRAIRIRDRADCVKKAADALNDSKLWEKRKITYTDEETGETLEKEDYDRDAILKAVKSLVSSYNDMVKEIGETNSREILKTGISMTKNISKYESLLSKAGISIGSGNKLELDEEKFAQADISTLKTLFSGPFSLADKVSQKAESISRSASKNGGTYNANGVYKNALSTVLAGRIDKEV